MSQNDITWMLDMESRAAQATPDAGKTADQIAYSGLLRSYLHLNNECAEARRDRRRNRRFAIAACIVAAVWWMVAVGEAVYYHPVVTPADVRVMQELPR